MASRVSIIIPAYNPGHYLALAIESVLAQTFTDWELFIIDDGSPEPIAPLVPVHPRIRILRQSNAGQAAARNLGIRESSSEFVAFLDQDDLFAPTKLEKQVALLDADPTWAACHTQFNFIDPDGIATGQGFGQRQTYTQMLEGSGICGASTVIVRRAALAQVGDFHLQDQPAEDLDLWLRISQIGLIEFIDEPLVSYRIHGANQSFQYRKTFISIRQIQLRHATSATPENQAAAAIGICNYRRDAAGKAFEQLRQAIRTGSLAEALRHGSFVLKNNPSRLLAAGLEKCCYSRARPAHTPDRSQHE